MKIIIIIFVALLLALAVYYATASGRIDRTRVPKLDLQRYMGTWYEIARFDHRFERGLDLVTAHYELQPDGRINVRNSGVELLSGKRQMAHGKAYAGADPGHLRVSFFWFFYADYNVLELGEDYDWALVGSKSPRYLWILSRTPRLPHHTLNHILHLAQQRGYCVGRLLFVDQG